MRYLCLVAALFLQLAACSRLQYNKRPLSELLTGPTSPSRQDFQTGSAIDPTTGNLDSPKVPMRPTKRPRGNDYSSEAKSIDLDLSVHEEESDDATKDFTGSSQEEEGVTHTTSTLPRGVEMEPPQRSAFKPYGIGERIVLAQRSAFKPYGLGERIVLAQKSAFKPYDPRERSLGANPTTGGQEPSGFAEEELELRHFQSEIGTSGRSAFTQVQPKRAAPQGGLESDPIDISMESTAEGASFTNRTFTAHTSQAEHLADQSGTARRGMITSADLVDRQAPNNDFVVTPAPVTTTTSTYSTPTVQAPAMNPWSEWRETLLEKKAVSNNFSMKDERIKQYVHGLCDVLAEYSKPVKPPSLSPYSCPSCYLLHQFEQHLRMAAIRVRDAYTQAGFAVDARLTKLCADPPEFFELPQVVVLRSQVVATRLLRMKMARHIHSLVDEQFSWNAHIHVVFDQITSYSRTVFETEKPCLVNIQPGVPMQTPVCNDGPSNADLWAVYRASLGKEVLARRDPSLQSQIDICDFLGVFKEFNKTIPCPPGDHIYLLVHHMGASIRDAAVLISKSIRDMKSCQFYRLTGEFTKKWLAKLSSDLPACFAPPEDLDHQTKERKIDGMINYLYKSTFKNARNIDFTQESHSLKTVRIEAISRLARKLFKAETRVADHLSGESMTQVVE